MDYFKDIPVWPFTIIAALLGILGTLIAQRISHYHVAISIFRNTIHSELKGIYPSLELYLPVDEINSKIVQSIPNIQLAVSNLQTFIPFYRKRWFNNAANKYYDTARKTDWNEQVTRQRFPHTSFNGPNPKDEFYKAVDGLLKFAK